MKKLPLQFLACLILSVFAFSSCLDDDDDYVPIPTGYMTFINGFSQSSQVVYDLNGPNSPFAVQYQAYLRPPYGVQVGQRSLQIYSYDDRAPLVDTLITVKDSAAYSTFAYGTIEEPQFALIEDKSLEDLDQKSAFRFLNLANNTGVVNLYLGDEATPIFEDRATETGTSATEHQTFIASESGSFSIKVTDASGAEVATRDNYEFKKGQYYTFILIGTNGDTDTPPYIGVVAY
ncbi:MAG: DUF4397 domain-containing protein [Sphingobacterium sp.]|uniref:DUF4397 domain-containing protein n=1 Tax=Sphingobacterium sp. JB170 TaxID=1434842 RepID=UPI00097E8E81|nr:DUF4397 domain-containing protein [Sphingobacterium sp. JB170]SJN39873.1 hypothetical protein FM107_10335 [Sphingobacterium sp. JB170]